MSRARTVRAVLLLAGVAGASCSKPSAPPTAASTPSSISPGGSQAPPGEVAAAVDRPRPTPPSGCAAAVFPEAQIVRVTGSARALSVRAPAGCAWKATSNDPWITVASGASGTGDGAVTLTIVANAGARPRNGSVFAGGRAFTVFQDGASALVHPRLWLNDVDVERLRGWAKDTNPRFKDLGVAAKAAVQEYDALFVTGKWGDKGGSTWTKNASEAYAEFFAFMSLLATEKKAKDGYAARARALLMHVIDEAAQGPAKAPFRDRGFGSYDRARWWGEAFPLTVDWIYPYLTADDKVKIQKAFLRWCAEIEASGETVSQVRNERKSVRRAANNYYLGYLRNLVMMALSLDPADDPPADAAKGANERGNTVRSYADRVAHDWLKPVNQLIGHGDASGGLPAEGFLYGEALGKLHEALRAMVTSGYLEPNDPAGELVKSGYWDDFLRGFLSSLTPKSTVLKDVKWVGDVYQMANYGDTLRLWIIPEWIGVFASIGLLDHAAGNDERLGAMRWIAENVLEGGKDKLSKRAGSVWGNSYATNAIDYFMLFDPAAPKPKDPRVGLPLSFTSQPIGRVVSRSGPGPDASMFSFLCSWNDINHQNGNCGQFDLYRKGEWITKERTGYTKSGVNSTSDYHNTLSLENDHLGSPPLQWFEPPINQRGSQYVLGQHGGDPVVLISSGEGYTHAQADATTLYNRPGRGTPVLADITQATRSIVWLAPDRVVVYDRASSKTAGRFKRFNLMLPTDPTIAGGLVTATTDGGQKVFVRSLLPAGASITAAKGEADHIAEGDTMPIRLVVEDKGTDVRFLHVIAGADAGATETPSTLVRSRSGTAFEGVHVGGVVILFPVSPIAAGGFKEVVYEVPASAAAHVITGLEPGASYDVAKQPKGANVEVKITPGSALKADAAGALIIGTLPR